jgi:hypothetical protein
MKLKDALPDMLSAQLLSADVYATFVKYSRGDERQLWLGMLANELSHIKFLGMLLEEEEVPDVSLPTIKLEAFREMYIRAQDFAAESAFERTLWALRMEHAEIDFAVESLAASIVSHSPNTPVYPGPMQHHYAKLLDWAQRYKGAHEISIQIARIEEHIPHASEAPAEKKA